ncbi:hypothetical protein ACFX13_013434 [Malus domestica]
MWSPPPSNFVKVNWWKGNCYYSLEAEVRTALLAMETTIENNLSQLIQNINEGTKQATLTIFPIIIQICNIRHRFQFLNWSSITGQANSIANWVALHCKRGDVSERLGSQTPIRSRSYFVHRWSSLSSLGSCSGFGFSFEYGDQSYA